MDCHKHVLLFFSQRPGLVHQVCSSQVHVRYQGGSTAQLKLRTRLANQNKTTQPVKKSCV